MKTLRFGIEIETVGASRQKLAHAIQGAVGGHVSGDYRGWQVMDSQGRAWKVVPDGSLSGGEYSGEIVSPILTYQDLEALQQVVRAAREAGARADASTGGLIHVDGSRFDAKGVTNLVKMVHKQERLLETALGVSAARLNRFCKPIDGAFLQRLEARRPRTLQDVNEAWYGRRNLAPQRYDSSRYYVEPVIMWRGTQPAST
ncbi:amidoligase family protein [Corallococcus sp. AS-1-12]|uniref:amidoligase family protein n=1 Tax=Corallococcus sp. AS-1-12 TaxID=2874598 RepID=UPI001CC03F08|nr:amidoligase family protein [Corallococcus sp. AS-1-12]